MSESITPEDIHASFDAEIQRLLALGLTPEEETITRRYYSQKERDSMDESDFCGPSETYPVKSQEDVDNAADLAGHAADPDAIRACVRRKAKANGWTLPKSWQEGAGSSDKGERAMPTEEEGITATDRISPLYFPITRAAPNGHDEWIVEGQATSDALDFYDTVFDYESAKRAFARWRGNLREQHDRHKAVGKAIDWIPDDENKRIILRSRVSKGAPDTWQKILDGVLTGYSVNLIPKSVKTRFVQRNGKTASSASRVGCVA